MHAFFVLSFIALTVAGIYEMYRKNGDVVCGLCIFISNLVLLWIFLQ